MKTIITRLMDSEEFSCDQAIPQIAYDAADEIERLVDENKELFEAMQHPSYEEENRLRAENAELKADLESCTNKLEMCEAMLAGDGALIAALKAELAEAERKQGFCFACGNELKAKSKPFAWAWNTPYGGTEFALNEHGCPFPNDAQPLYTHPAPADKDAERYRWIRDKWDGEPASAEFYSTIRLYNLHGKADDAFCSAQSLDAAIDAAIAMEGK